MSLSRSVRLSALALLGTFAVLNVSCDAESSKKPWKPMKQPWWVEKKPQRFYHDDPAVKIFGASCHCSPSKRGYLKKTVDFLFFRVSKAQIEYVGFLNSVMDHSFALYFSSLEKKAKKDLEKAKRKAFDDCWPRWGTEACVNADAANRARGAAICSYVKWSGKNVFFLKTPPTKRPIVGTTKSCRVTWPSMPWALSHS